MQVYDYIMIGVLLGATIFGAWKGLAWQLASLASLVLSYFAALRLSPLLSAYFPGQPPANRLLAMLAIYTATSLVVWLLFRSVAGFIDRLRLREFDRQMGAVIGAAKGVLLCVVITMFAATLTAEPTRSSILDSRSGKAVGYVLNRAPAMLPEEVRLVLAPYLKHFDEPPPSHVDGAEQPVDPAAPTATLPGGGA